MLPSILRDLSLNCRKIINILVTFFYFKAQIYLYNLFPVRDIWKASLLYTNLPKILTYLFTNINILNKYFLSACYVLGIIDKAMIQFYHERAHNPVDKGAKDLDSSDFRIFPEFHGILWILGYYVNDE